MRLAKKTYSLPPDLAARFEECLAPGERSGLVARLIAEWLAEREREALRRELVEGCKQMSDLYREVDQEWSRAADEVWRGAE